MVDKQMKLPSAPQVLLAMAAFLIPLMGGQISSDQALPLAPGFLPLVLSILGGPFAQGYETPLLSHLVIGLLIALALAMNFLQRSVIQLPSNKLSALMVGFFGLLFVSVGLSEFRFVSMAAIAEWLLYALAFFAAVSVLGRQQGPRLVLGAMFAGVCVIAFYGIGLEYREMRVIDPSYRIFAGWVNPNAVAGMLLIGLFIGCGLLSGLSRIAALLSIIGCLLISTAIFLTGSKAGIGASIVGGLIYAFLSILWPGELKSKLFRASTAMAFLAIGFGLFTLIYKANTAPSASGAPAIGRLSTYNETQAQSLGFRKLLWKGSFDLSIQRPTGFGIGTYRFEGSRPGLTTQTQLAHSNHFQLAVEASWLSVLILSVALGYWLILMFRGARSMPQETNTVRAGIVAAVVATLAHGVFESNLYYFGIGLSFFLLMGIGLCLGADSVAPEYTPRGARWGLATLSFLPILMLAYFGWAEWQRSQLRFAIQSGQLVQAREIASELTRRAPMDGEAWNTLYLLEPGRRAEAIERAAAVSPSPRILRNLARFHQSQKRFASAEAAINLALARDPNNLNTLKLGMDVSRSFGEQTRAKYYAERMIGVERMDYFRIRSLPQMVETATANARIYLATLVSDPQQKIALLIEAHLMFVQYASTTVPEVKKFTDAGTDFVGESAAKARGVCEDGISVAKNLASLYRRIGDKARADEVIESVADFEAAISSLGGSK